MKFKLVLALIAPLTLLSGCGKTRGIKIDYPNAKMEDINSLVFSSSLEDGEIISTLDDSISNLVSQYEVFNFFGENLDCADLYFPKPLELSWEIAEKTNRYEVYYGTDYYLKDFKVAMSDDETVKIKDLFTNTRYYYQIVAYYSNYATISIIHYFDVANVIRTIDIEGVSNTRDIGGCITEDGKYRVKQGMLFRGANLDSITTKGIDNLTLRHGVKTDLDLRESSSSTTPLGPRAKHIQHGDIGCPLYTYQSNGILATANGYKENLTAYLKEFAKKDNYPM